MAALANRTSETLSAVETARGQLSGSVTQLLDRLSVSNARLGELMGEVSQQWASDLDARGRPGTDILNAFRAALEKAD